MNKFFNFDKNKLKEYLPTIGLSILFTIVASFCVELDLMFKSEKSVTINRLSVKNLSKFCTIEELEKQLALNPLDDIVHIRLAQVYESIGKYNEANEYYKKGLKLSGRTNYALYSYATFCAKHGLYVIAATLAEELSGNAKYINLFKAKIYEQIGVGLDKEKKYQASVKSFQVAYKYAKNVSDKKFFNSIKKQYSDEYVKLADYNMKIDEPAEAVANLNNSLKIRENPDANYRLGIIYLSTDLYNAEKHINKAFAVDPYIVNPYIYNNVLNELLEKATQEGKGNLMNFYSSRINRFKKVLNEVYLYKTDISIDNSALLAKKSLFKDKKYYLFFELKNNTNTKINNIYLRADVFVNGKKYEIEKKLITPTSPLEALETIQVGDYAIPKEAQFNNLDQNNDIFVRYYAKKTQEAPWVLVKIDFLNI